MEDQEIPRRNKDRTICRIYCVCARGTATGRILLPSASEIAESRGVDKDFFKVRNYVSNNRDKGNKCNETERYLYEVNFQKFITISTIHIYIYIRRRFIEIQVSTCKQVVIYKLVEELYEIKFVCFSSRNISRYIVFIRLR